MLDGNRTARVGVWVAVGVAVGLATVVAVSAHMALQKSVPEADAVLTSPPTQVQLWFTQDPDPAVSNVSLEGPSGDVDIGETTVAAEKSIVAVMRSADTEVCRSAGEDESGCCSVAICTPAARAVSLGRSGPR